MNILVWNSWVSPSGGMERVALSIANGLAERPDAHVVLAGPYDTVPVLQERISPHVHFVPCTFDRSASGLFRNYSTLSRIVEEHRIDVISAHGSLIPLLPMKVPVAWTEHGPRYGDQPIFQGVRRLLWQQVRQRLLANEWKLVACSRYVRDRLCPQFGLPPERAAVILNGVPNTQRFRDLEPPRFEKPFRLGLIGRLEPEKHPMDIIELDKRLAARGVCCEWHIFGTGSLEHELRARAAVEPRIHVHGLVADSAAAFEKIDALVFLSHGQMEGLPTVILESRLARRPVIAWNVTAIPEAAGHLDELVEPFNLNRFADAIERVLLRAEAPPQESCELEDRRMIDQYWDLLSEMSGVVSRPHIQKVMETV